jgi:MFS family permease
VGGGHRLALANFLAVLNMTIANVTVPNMAGALGAGSSQGTWVITAYAVAEAITVPLTGWLSARFGAVRVFSISVVMFGIFSLFCGMSTSLGMLLAMRVFQGMAGGPLLALSQTLLLRIFPKEQSMQAMGLWAMTTLLAPVVGPVLGGWLCDNYSWSWVFFINVPMALIFAAIAWGLLKRYEEPGVRNPVDMIGFLLLVIWVASLQIMLDEGKDLDWFSSDEIRILAVVAVIGFISFLIWELTEEHPIVDLRVFRHRGFTACMVVLALAFGAFFGINVLTPLWLQYNMGYNTTWAGLVVAWGGLLSVVFSPVAAKLANRVDARWLIFIGCVLAGRRYPLAGGGHLGHELLDDLHPAVLHGRRHADVLRPADRAGYGFGGRSGDGIGRRANELRAHDFRRLRHLARHDRLAGPQLYRPRPASQHRRSHWSACRHDIRRHGHGRTDGARVAQRSCDQPKPAAGDQRPDDRHRHCLFRLFLCDRPGPEGGTYGRCGLRWALRPRLHK